MPWIAPVIAAGASLGGAAMGASAQRAGLEQAKEAYERSVADLEAIGIPTVEAQQIAMEEYKSAGQWTPELEEAIKMGDTSMGGIAVEPGLKEAQLKALGQLQEIGDQGGMTLTDRANLERTMGGVRSKMRGNREAILQNAAEQGGYGSGTALAAQLMAQQQGAEEAHMAGLNTAASARDRALESIMKAGDLGTSLRNQSFGEQERVAQAKDAIAKWNAQNAQDVMQRNSAMRNEASRYNLGNAQGIANANVDTRNKEQLYNKSLQQQQYQNELAKAQAKSNARSGQAQTALTGGQNEAQLWANVGSAIGKGAMGYEQQRLDREAQAEQQKRIKTGFSGGA